MMLISMLIEALLVLVISIVLCCIIHEGSHYLVAKLFGKTIKFKFNTGKLFNVIPIPRWTWQMPEMEEWKQRLTALAGFAVEELVAVIVALFVAPIYDFALIFFAVAMLHLLAYNLYAGEANDFNYIFIKSKK